MQRPIITIDEEKCNGCGQCILDCAEGALAIVDGKAKLVSEVYCDGLGACLNCPQGALTLEMRDAPPFDEAAALAAKKAADEKAKAAPKPLHGLKTLRMAGDAGFGPTGGDLMAELPSWPIQLALLGPSAGFLDNAHMLLAAHCAGFALPGMRQDFLKGRIPAIACPKLEDNAMLTERLAAILSARNVASLTVLRMSVPCCGGLVRIAEKAIEKAGVSLPFSTHVVRLS